MITDAELDSLRDIVLHNFKFTGNPYDFMWTDDDSEPIDGCDALWTDPKVLDIKYGCSKAVLFYDYLGDYVIKVPFCGVCTEEGRYINFSHATEDPDDIDENWDYCEAEESLYKKACAAGIGELFCGTRHLCDINNFPIYISEKSDYTIDEDESSRDSSAAGLRFVQSKREQCDIKCIYHPGDMEDNILGMFYDFWGAEITDKFLDFLVDNNIRDCHNGNIAFRDGKIRVIDYSSFNK